MHKGSNSIQVCFSFDNSSGQAPTHLHVVTQGPKLLPSCGSTFPLGLLVVCIQVDRRKGVQRRGTAVLLTLSPGEPRPALANITSAHIL